MIVRIIPLMTTAFWGVFSVCGRELTEEKGQSFTNWETFLVNNLEMFSVFDNFAVIFKEQESMINKDNLKYFALPQEADNWVWRIEHGVSDWVNKQGKRGTGDKSYWKLVFWFSQTYLKILIPEILIFTELDLS